MEASKNNVIPAVSVTFSSIVAQLWNALRLLSRHHAWPHTVPEAYLELQIVVFSNFDINQ